MKKNNCCPLLKKKSISELESSTIEKIHDIYQQMLLRNADNVGLTHFGSMIESQKMTFDDVRNEIFNSKEGTAIRLSAHGTHFMTNDIFTQFFDRPASQEELDFYSDLVESKKFTQFFDRPASQEELDLYSDYFQNKTLSSREILEKIILE